MIYFGRRWETNWFDEVINWVWFDWIVFGKWLIWVLWVVLCVFLTEDIYIVYIYKWTWKQWKNSAFLAILIHTFGSKYNLSSVASIQCSRYTMSRVIENVKSWNDPFKNIIVHLLPPYPPHSSYSQTHPHKSWLFRPPPKDKPISISIYDRI